MTWRVDRDATGIPHLWADDVLELARAQGRVTALDRGWQVEHLRWRMEGRTAEHVGPAGVAWDTFARQVRLEQTVRRSYEALDDETQSVAGCLCVGCRRGTVRGAVACGGDRGPRSASPLRQSHAPGRRGPLWASSGRSTCSSGASPTSSSTVMSRTPWGPTCCPSSTPRGSTVARGSSSRAATPGWSEVIARRRVRRCSPETRTARSNCPAATSRWVWRARSSTSWASPSPVCRASSTSRTRGRSPGASRTPWRTTRT